MSLLEPAPALPMNQLFHSSEAFFALVNSEELSRVLDQANQGYLYWDDFKYLPRPAEVSPESAWALLKLNRSQAYKKLPFTDKEGRPFHYWIPEFIQQKLHTIDLHAGGNLSSDAPLNDDDRKRYVVSSLMEEAIASSLLEGAATTRKDAKELLLRRVAPKTVAQKMIVNNYRTIQRVMELAGEPLTPHLVQSIQRVITEETLEDPADSGRFRSGDEVVYVRRNEHLLFTSPPGREVQARIEQLCAFANSDEGHGFIHPVVKAILLHFMLAYIHPFADGNGRTARALFYWYLIKRNYWLFQYLPISKIILDKPRQYEKAFLCTEHDENDLTYFIHFNMGVIDKAVADAVAYIRRKQREQAAARKIASNHPELNTRQQGLLYHALSHPDARYTFRTHQTIHKVVYQTARTDLIGLETLGYLVDKPRGNRHFYFPAPDLKKRLGSGRG